MNQFLELGYIALSATVLLIFLFGYYNVLLKQYSKGLALKRAGFITGIVSLWGVYIYLVTKSAILLDFSFPPRFPLLILLPLIMLFVFFWKKNKNNPIIQSIPLTWSTSFQAFRIFVELLLLYTFYEDIIPKTATFEGLNFDILVGISAPFITYFFVYRSLKRTLLKIWNVVGVFMILWVAFIIGTSTYIPEIWNSEIPLVAHRFFSLPYFLVACFLAPIGIFMHLVGLIGLRNTV